MKVLETWRSWKQQPKIHDFKDGNELIEYMKTHGHGYMDWKVPPSYDFIIVFGEYGEYRERYGEHDARISHLDEPLD